MPRYNMCEDCKRRIRPHIFSVLFTAVPDICSFCGKPNFDGIYVRDDKRTSTGTKGEIETETQTK